MNEELETINSELQTRLDDLALAQSDMQNLLNSTDIATLFLDNDLNVRRFTEKAVGIFHLRESDVGRPLSDLANTMAYPLLQDDVKETLRTLTPCTKSVAATDGRWFSVRIMPYRTLANTVNGAVLTFVDISTAKALEFRLRETSAPLKLQRPHDELSISRQSATHVEFARTGPNTIAHERRPDWWYCQKCQRRVPGFV